MRPAPRRQALGRTNVLILLLCGACSPGSSKVPGPGGTAQLDTPTEPQHSRVNPGIVTTFSSATPSPDMGVYEQPMFAPDGSWAIFYYITEGEYLNSVLRNGWMVRPFNSSDIALDPQGGLDFSGTFGPGIIIEDEPWDPTNPFVFDPVEAQRTRMDYHAELDVRFDVPAVNALIQRVATNQSLPIGGVRIDEIPYRSDGFLPDPQGSYWTYPFIASVRLIGGRQDITGLDGAVMGTRLGMVTLTANKRQVHPPGTLFLEPLQPMITDDRTIWADGMMRGIEPTLFPLTGDTPTGVAGYILCFNGDPGVGMNMSKQIFCSATTDSDPSAGWVRPVRLTNFHQLGGMVMADGRPLEEHFPLLRKPLAAPDGSTYDGSYRFWSAYPWFTPDGEGLLLRNSPVLERWPLDGQGQPGPVDDEGTIRAALQFYSTDLVNEAGTHYKSRIMQGLYQTRMRDSSLSAFVAGRVGPYQWHLGGRGTSDASFPATDFNHSQLVCDSVFEFDLQRHPTRTGNHRRHALRCNEDFYLPLELRAEGQSLSHGGWLAYFSGTEVYAPALVEGNAGQGTRADPTRALESIREYHGDLVNGATFPQEYQLAQPNGQGFYDVDQNGGVLGQGIVLPPGGSLHSAGPAYAGTFAEMTMAFFVDGASPNVTASLGQQFTVRVSSQTVELSVNGQHLASARPATTQWQHIAAIFDSARGEMALFVDGDRQALESVAAVALQTTSAEFEVSSSLSTNAPTLIDEVVLTRWAMSPSQIRKMALRRVVSQRDASGLTLSTGLDPSLARIPSHNTLQASDTTDAKIELGRRLFFDKTLSADGEVSCGSCHQPALAFTDGLQLPKGVFNGQGSERNAPSVLNMVFRSRYFWDGRAPSLEDQVIEPFVAPTEMGLTDHDELVMRINSNRSRYESIHHRAYGAPHATVQSIAYALASFVRTLSSGNSRVDRFINGETNALSQSEQRGLAIFRNQGRCASCHRLDGQLGPAERETMTVKTGIVAPQDEGNGYGEFLVPSLRNVSRTAPYFHDGSSPDLTDVVRRYNDGAIHVDSFTSPVTIRPLGLTTLQRADLVAFLMALDSELPQVSTD